MTSFPEKFPFHFRTLPRFMDGVEPVEPVSHSEFKRVMFRSTFTGISITGTITPNVSYDTVTVTGDSVLESIQTRATVKRAAPIRTDRASVITDAVSLNLTGSLGTYTPSVLTDGATTGDQYLVLIASLLVDLGFMRHERAQGLVFCAFTEMGDVSVTGVHGGENCRMYLYAPVIGSTPEDFYGFAAPTSSPPYTCVPIAESDAGSLFGVTLKQKGWSLEIDHTGDGGTEIYTPSITVSEI